MTQDRPDSVFTWRDYEARGFGELQGLLGEGWEVVDQGGEPEVVVQFAGTAVGTLMAISPFDIELHLGPSECLYIDPERYDGSCLSLTLEGELFPEASNPEDLAAAAAVFQRRVAEPR